MRVELILNRANEAWILQKFAERLQEELTGLGHDAAIVSQETGTQDISHHLSWAFAHVKSSSPSTMFVTHLDDMHKIRQVKTILAEAVSVGVCMSRDTALELAEAGVPDQSLIAINPAHDHAVSPRRIILGLTTRLYSDGRKREAVLVEACGKMDMSGFEFRIHGDGWQDTIPALKASGAEVTYHPDSGDFAGDYQRIITDIPQFDYYIYLGIDEGSMGTLDALAAGVATIVTPQGFHLDVADGITYPVVTADDLVAVFQKIAAPRQARIDGVARLTWRRYTEEHVALWENLIAGTRLANGLADLDLGHGAELITLRQETIAQNGRSVRRILSTLSRTPALRPLRGLVDKWRL
ncbi:MAG: hypothetical protein P1U83_18585 [Roseovarius sp.]|nr:hypothetical protein [Roseovarius sp.]